MMRFDQVMSRRSWFFAGFFVLPAFIVIFQPTLLQFLVAQAVDLVALGCCSWLERRFFSGRRQGDLFFPEPKEEAIGKLSPTGKQALFEALVRFPKIHARFLVAFSFVKLIPSGAVIVGTWAPEFPFWHRLISFLGVELILHIYLYTAIFIDHHDLVTRTISRLHRKFDFSLAFERSLYPLEDQDFSSEEIGARVSIFIFTSALILFLIYQSGLGIYPGDLTLLGLPLRESQSSNFILSAKVLVILLCGFVLMSRISFVSRAYFIDGLRKLKETFRSHSIEEKRVCLSLHSSGLLASLEREWNALTQRLQAREREIAAWMLREVEESRIRHLGYLSAMLVHNLHYPMTSIHQSIQGCLERPQDPETESDLSGMAQVCAKTELLFSSLRTFLTDREPVSQQASFRAAHENALGLIQMRPRRGGRKPPVYHLDDRLGGEIPLIAMNPADLMAVLYNLYLNGIESAERNDPACRPSIRTKLHRQEGGFLVLHVMDNGEGLSRAQYERLTSLDSLLSDRFLFRRSLGLRVARWLIESGGGRLEVTTSVSRRGTTFSLKLPLGHPQAEKLPLGAGDAFYSLQGIDMGSGFEAGLHDLENV